jgi:hypothetical protein
MEKFSPREKQKNRRGEGKLAGKALPHGRIRPHALQTADTGSTGDVERDVKEE